MIYATENGNAIGRNIFFSKISNPFFAKQRLIEVNLCKQYAFFPGKKLFLTWPKSLPGNQNGPA